MEFIAQMWANIVHVISYFGPFVLVLSVVVVIHELGHYLVGRWCHVKVDAFSLGFGPELFGFTNKRGERWKVCAIPLGGYVKFYGDEDAASLPDEATLAKMKPTERAQTLPGRPLAQRAAVVAAGPFANFLLAIVIFFVLFATIGRPVISPIIDEIQPESAAQIAGLQVGDKVLKIDGTTIESFGQLQRVVTFNAETPLQFVVQRGDKSFNVVVTPKLKQEKDSFGAPQRIGLIGVKRNIQKSDVLTAPMPVGTAFVESLKETWFIVDRTFAFIGGMISGKESSKQLGGPLRIAQASGEAASFGIISTIQLIALLSVSIGLLNLFPIPLLDGGHLVFYAVEAIRGKPLSERAQEWSFRIGFGFVIFLMLFSTFNDIVLLTRS